MAFDQHLYPPEQLFVHSSAIVIHRVSRHNPQAVIKQNSQEGVKRASNEGDAERRAFG